MGNARDRQQPNEDSVASTAHTDGSVAAMVGWVGTSLRALRARFALVLTGLIAHRSLDR